MRIEVKSEAVSERKGVGENGKPWAIREQQAYAYTTDKEGKPDEYPSKVTLRLEEGEKPYKVGLYTLADQSFYVGQYGRLTVGRPVLQPLDKAMARAA